MGSLSQPLAKLLERLNAHAAPTKILEGFRIEPKPETQTEGVDDLPRVMVVGVQIQDDSKSQNQSFATVTVRLAVASRKTGGMTGHLEDIEKVLDAVETATDGAVDGTVGNSTIRGLRLTGDDTEVTGTALQTPILVTLETVPFNRAARREAV